MGESSRLEQARLAYISARINKEMAADAVKRAKRAMTDAEEALVEVMQDDDIQNFTMDTGLQCYIHQNFRISVTEKNHHEVRDWLLETTGDDQPFMEEKLDRKAVEDHCRELAKTEGKDRIPQCLSLYTNPGIGVRGWKEALMYQKPEKTL